MCACRSPWSTEILVLLMALKLRHPHALFLLRGNHELQSINRCFGLHDECVGEKHLPAELLLGACCNIVEPIHPSLSLSCWCGCWIQCIIHSSLLANPTPLAYSQTRLHVHCPSACVRACTAHACRALGPGQWINTVAVLQQRLPSHATGSHCGGARDAANAARRCCSRYSHFCHHCCRC